MKMDLTRASGRAESPSTAPGDREDTPGSGARGLALPGVDFSKVLLDKTTSHLGCVELNAENWAKKGDRKSIKGQKCYILTPSLVHGF